MRCLIHPVRSRLQVPMFRDLMVASGCGRRGGGPGIVDVTFAQLELDYMTRCRPTDPSQPPPPGCVPSGFVFHQSRCGSTLIANMITSLVRSSPRPVSRWVVDLMSVSVCRSCSRGRFCTPSRHCLLRLCCWTEASLWKNRSGSFRC